MVKNLSSIMKINETDEYKKASKEAILTDTMTSGKAKNFPLYFKAKHISWKNKRQTIF
jgi:hypothetical protein